jgi:hypothetical protein
MTLIRRAWAQKKIQQSEGIIHPLGVTIYLPTKELITAGAGPAVSDIGNKLYNTSTEEAKTKEDKIHLLVSKQEEANKIPAHAPKNPAIAIKYFEMNQLSNIEQWLEKNLAVVK